MIIISCIIMLMISLIMYLVTRSILNPITIINSIFGVILVISKMGLYNLFIPSNDTYYIIILGILSFNIGAIIILLASKVKIMNRGNIIEVKKEKIYIERKNLMKVLLVVGIILLIPYVIRAISVSLTNGYGNVREQAFLVGGDILKGIYDLYMLQWVIEPIIYSNQVLLGIKLTSCKFKEIRIYSILVLLITLLHSLAFGGRVVLVRLIFFSVLPIMLYRKNINVKRLFNLKNKIILAIALFCVLGVIIYSGNARAGKSVSVLEVVVDYFVGPIGMMNIAVTKVQDVFTFTGTLVGGILDIIKILVNSVLGSSFLTSAISYSNYTAPFVYIGDGKAYNALATAFFSFYIDGGIISVLIYSFIAGFISMFIYFRRNKNTIYTIIYIIILYCLVMSIQRWEPLMAWIWLSSILAIINFKKYKFKGDKQC